jgi:hypothetical protein
MRRPRLPRLRRRKDGAPEAVEPSAPEPPKAAEPAPPETPSERPVWQAGPPSRPEVTPPESPEEPTKSGRLRRFRLRRRGPGKEEVSQAGPPGEPPKRRRRIRRPRVPRPRRPRLRRPERARDLGFRISTRFRAIGYWLREKWQGVARRGGALGTRVGSTWSARPAWLRRGLAGAAVLIAVLAIVRFAPIPGIPCQVSAPNQCAPSDQVVEIIPSDALLYAHATLDRDTAQFERSEELADEVPGFPVVLENLLSSVATPSGAEIDFNEQIAPWAGDDAGYTIVPSPDGSQPSAFLISASDRQGAEQFLGSIAPAAPTEEKQGQATISVYPGGFASAFVEDFLVFGDELAVRGVLDAAAGTRPALDSGAPATLRDRLPENRVADIYISGEGARAILANLATGSTQLDTFIDYQTTTGVAAAAIAQDDGLEIQLLSLLDRAQAKATPPFFSNLPRFEPELDGEVGARALGYIGVGEVGPSLVELVERAEGTGGELTRALNDFSKRLSGQAGVDPFQDLLPALGGQAAVTAEPTDGPPFASLIVDDVDEEQARTAMARLQTPVLAAIETPTGTTPAAFEQEEVEGVEVNSVQVSPTVNLSYAIFDRKLVVSTDPAGISQVRAGSEPLADSGAFEKATAELPGDPSALVFLNLDELLGLAEQAGLAEDPLYASFRDDIAKLQSVALSVIGEETTIRSELFLAIK